MSHCSESYAVCPLCTLQIVHRHQQSEQEAAVSLQDMQDENSILQERLTMLQRTTVHLEKENKEMERSAFQLEKDNSVLKKTLDKVLYMQWTENTSTQRYIDKITDPEVHIHCAALQERKPVYGLCDMRVNTHTCKCHGSHQYDPWKPVELCLQLSTGPCRDRGAKSKRQRKRVNGEMGHVGKNFSLPPLTVLPLSLLLPF